MGIALAPGAHLRWRAVVSLALDSNVMALTGQTLIVGNLARKYGFTDIDGTQPQSYEESI